MIYKSKVRWSLKFTLQKMTFLFVNGTRKWFCIKSSRIEMSWLFLQILIIQITANICYLNKILIIVNDLLRHNYCAMIQVHSWCLRKNKKLTDYFLYAYNKVCSYFVTYYFLNHMYICMWYCIGEVYASEK